MYNKYRGRGFHPMKIVFFMLVMVFFILAAGWVVMFLWNNILVDVTNVKPLTYMQAIGLLILSKILFGGFRFGGPRYRGGRHKRRSWKEKWSNMTEEEKAAFKEKWRNRCK